MNTLFPLITEYNEEFKEYYTYRQIYFKWNINSEAYRLHKQYDDFPDPSYYWVYPKGEEPKERHVLFGTYYIQHEIWKHQFPATCEDKKYLIVPLWHAGMGSVIHVLTQSFIWALDSNRIMIVKYIYKMSWGDPEFCDADNQSILCYLQPMTNCTVSDEDVRIAFNKNTPFISPTHAHITNYTEILKSDRIPIIFAPFSGMNHRELPGFYSTYRTKLAPFFITHFFKNSKIHSDAKWYWRIQGATFITRLNERTVNWIREYEKENCKGCTNEYDISTHIRHGDKGIEMKLIDADVYKEAIKILASLGLKKNHTVYVNADDQESVDVIHSLPYDVASFNQSRHNYGVIQNKDEKNVGLISFANLYNQIRADHSVGTIHSNWCQLIYELKLTVGMKSDGFILEVG